ncbi:MULTISPECIES: helix-turn-helix transcriptional regulator [unclassified Janthinobacterium]|uniref:helix-turn-helix transcriptional regulator n=1 Tax=unclassified Janthinobacterium TaxID=2610881 RepID=UPI0012FBF566|nr:MULTISPECIES: hypothetical protein [unclassified Janthinobacterium]MEC5164199.1 DNA-binding CsgD family transcriptional regulator [Janthinobacterium sp. CG_S6]
MTNLTRLANSAVEQFYEGITAPAAWQDALNSLRLIAGSAHVALTTWERTRNITVLHESIELPQKCRQQFSDYYHVLDPTRDNIDRIAVGSWYIDRQHLNSRVIGCSPFYQEFMRDYGLDSIIATPLVRDGTGDSFLVFQFGLNEAHSWCAPLELCEVLPHIRRALLLRRRFSALAIEKSICADVLAGLQTPLLVVDATARIIIANKAAESALKKYRCINIAAERLVLTGVDSPHFASLLAHACGGEARRVAGAMLAGRVDGPPLQILVAPLPEQHAPSSGGRSPLALVLLRDVRTPFDTPVKLLQQLYGLTASEARIALGVLHGGTPSSLAASSSVSMATVRTQLSAVFQKTGTRRQAELVQLLGTFSMVTVTGTDPTIVCA